MTLEVVGAIAVGAGVFGYVGRAWLMARRRQKRLSVAYERLDAEPTTVVTAAVVVPAPREPPRRPRARSWVAWQSRHPTRMNLPALEPDPRGFDPALTLSSGAEDDETSERTADDDELGRAS